MADDGAPRVCPIWASLPPILRAMMLPQTALRDSISQDRLSIALDNLETKRLALLPELVKLVAVFDERNTRPDSEKRKLDIDSIHALTVPFQSKTMGGLESAKAEVAKLEDAEAQDFADAAHWQSHVEAREKTVRLVEDFTREIDQEFAKFVEEMDKLMGEESPWPDGAPELPPTIPPRDDAEEQHPVAYSFITI